MENTENTISETLDFNIFWGRMPPDPPYKLAPPALDCMPPPPTLTEAPPSLALGLTMSSLSNNGAAKTRGCILVL